MPTAPVATAAPVRLRRLALPTRIHRAARRATAHLGVHGCGLLFIAVVWWIIGHGYALGWYAASLYLSLVGFVVIVAAIPDESPQQ